MLGEVTEDQVGRYRRDLVKPGLAKLAFDVVLFGKAKAAVELYAGLGGRPRGGAKGVGELGVAPRVAPRFDVYGL